MNKDILCRAQMTGMIKFRVRSYSSLLLFGKGGMFYIYINSSNNNICSMLFCCNIDEITEEPNSCLYQLDYGKNDFVICPFA